MKKLLKKWKDKFVSEWVQETTGKKILILMTLCSAFTLISAFTLNLSFVLVASSYVACICFILWSGGFIISIMRPDQKEINDFKADWKKTSTAEKLLLVGILISAIVCAMVISFQPLPKVWCAITWFILVAQILIYLVVYSLPTKKQTKN